MNKSFGLRKRAAIILHSNKFHANKRGKDIQCNKHIGRKSKSCETSSGISPRRLSKRSSSRTGSSSGTKRNYLRNELLFEEDDLSTYDRLEMTQFHNVICAYSAPFAYSSTPTPFTRVPKAKTVPEEISSCYNPFKKYSETLNLSEQVLNSMLKLASGTANGKTKSAIRIKPYWPLKWDPKPTRLCGRVVIRTGIRRLRKRLR